MLTILTNNHFFDHPMTFSEVCTPLKLSESIRFFFQPRHIEYALGVKNVKRVPRVTERVERGSGKKMLTVRTISHDSKAEEREVSPPSPNVFETLFDGKVCQKMLYKFHP